MIEPITWFAIGFVISYIITRQIIKYVRRRRVTHGHRCPCGNTWRHTCASVGNVEDHTCKKCGTQIWWATP